MWKAQSYLYHPNIDFPVYVYVFAGRYIQWDSESLNRLMHILTVLGHDTGENVCIVAPIDGQRSAEVREYLQEVFPKLTERLKLGGENIGILVCNLPIPKLNSFGSNGRWAWFRFEPTLKILGGTGGVAEVADAIRDYSTEPDPVQAILREVTRAERSLLELFKDVNWSISGPSLTVRSILRGVNSIETNIYD